MAISMQAPATSGSSGDTLPDTINSGTDSTRHSQLGHCTGRCPASPIARYTSYMDTQIEAIYKTEKTQPPMASANASTATRQAPVIMRVIICFFLQTGDPDGKIPPAPDGNPPG